MPSPAPDPLAEDARFVRTRVLTPEEAEVLRTAVAEYRAGHRADRASAKDPAVVYTQQDKDEYQRALYAHYQAVRALLRQQQSAHPATEEPEHAEVRP